MREPIDFDRTIVFIKLVLIVALTVITYSAVDRLRNIEIPHISDKDLVFWLVEFHEQ
ncbi:MAG: hypothetical protein ACFCAD_17690 [Pleurocapsa sp.]